MFNVEQFKQSRRTQKQIGIGLIIFGIVTMLLDLRVPLPIPARIAVFLLGGCSLLAGILMVMVIAVRLPLSEAVQLARNNNNALSLHLLISEMELHPDTATKVIRALENRGLVRPQEREAPDNQNQVMIWTLQ